MPNRSRRKRQSLPEEPIQLLIDRMSHDGRGIASNNGKIAFVDGALPGETVSARFTGTRSRYDELEICSVTESSPHRAEPDCEYFGLCGGCSLQHMESVAQITFKQDLLMEQLEHATGINLIDIGKLPALQGDSYHYRRKARLAVRYVAKKGGALVGFREKNSTFITVMDHCQVLIEPLSDLIKPLRELINNLTAGMHIPQFEAAVGETHDGGYKIALVMRHLQALPDSDLTLLKLFAQDHQCEFYLQPKGPESIHKVWPETGAPRLQYFLPRYELVMHFHPCDFVQVNGSINRSAIPLAIELLNLEENDTVLDLFCGLGNFTLPMAKFCRTVIGVEGSAEMVERARENAKLNGIENVQFQLANLYETAGNQSWSQQKFDKVLLDPPRSGALEVVDRLSIVGARKIVYISCNPATLARDASRLLEKGYILKRAGVMDMFPHTAHVESIAEFELL